MTAAVSAAQLRHHPRTRPRTAAARPDGLRRVVGTLHDPNALTVGIVLVTGVVLIARHPIAQAIGTETPVRPAVATPAPSAPRVPTHAAPALAAPVVAAVATHAPRDPFRALVAAGGRVLAPVDSQPTTSVPTPAPVPATVSCTGRSHRVAAGDTLWTLAARAVRSHDTGRVTVAWHRLYAANRAAVGSDPSVLQVGTSLCVPTSL